MKKNLTRVPFILFIVALSSLDAYAGPGIVIGYKYIHLDYEYDHDTHPDDDFLPDAGASGSAGTTRIDEGTNWLFLGGRYVCELNRDSNHTPWKLNFDLGVLWNPLRDNDDYSDFKQNENDPRPEDEGSNIYSRISRWGFNGSASMTFHYRPFFIGPEAQLSAIWLEHGWNRFNTDEVEEDGFGYFPSVGFKMGIDHETSSDKDASVERSLGIEFSLQAMTTGGVGAGIVGYLHF